jgi:hypothetical protein
MRRKELKFVGGALVEVDVVGPAAAPVQPAPVAAPAVTQRLPDLATVYGARRRAMGIEDTAVAIVPRGSSLSDAVAAIYAKRRAAVEQAREQFYGPAPGAGGR